MLYGLRRWRERRALDRELARLDIPEQLRLPPCAQVEPSRRPALISRQDLKAVAVAAGIYLLAFSPLVGWSAYGLTITEQREQAAIAEVEYQEAFAAYEGAMAVELQDEPVPDDPIRALETAMTPTTEAGQDALADLRAAGAAMEASESPSITDLWLL